MVLSERATTLFFVVGFVVKEKDERGACERRKKESGKQREEVEVEKRGEERGKERGRRGRRAKNLFFSLLSNTASLSFSLDSRHVSLVPIFVATARER